MNNITYLYNNLLIQIQLWTRFKNIGFKLVISGFLYFIIIIFDLKIQNLLAFSIIGLNINSSIGNVLFQLIRIFLNCVFIYLYLRKFFSKYYKINFNSYPGNFYKKTKAYITNIYHLKEFHYIMYYNIG